MGREMTEDELKDERVQSMGPDLGPVFHALWNEVAWLHEKWQEYCELFGTRASRIELMNEAAPMFFRIVQDSLFEDILIHITRLTDPPKSCGKENLTICRIPSLLSDQQARANVKELIDVASQKAAFCRDWRNRHIAHTDLDLALKEGAKPLEAASRQEVKKALEAISNVLNSIETHYTGKETCFGGDTRPGGAVGLIGVIDAGLRAEKERNERMEAGEYRPEDFQHRDL